MNFFKGNLIDLAESGEFDIIVHGCNCFNTMGSGIAKEIKARYPKAYEEDLQTIRGDYRKLGNYTIMLGKRFNIVNAYTQYDYNRPRDEKDVFEYISFAMILQKLGHEYRGSHFGFPKIGCGLAGGDEPRIMEMIQTFDETLALMGGSASVVEFG